MKRALAGLVLGLGLMCATYELAEAQAVLVDENGEPIPEKEPEKPDPLGTMKTIGSYGLVLLGFGMVGLAVLKTFSSSMSYPQARLMLQNLLRTNPNQAELMTKRMQGTFCEAIAAAIKVGGMTGSTDQAMIASATLPTYDATGQGIVAKWGGILGKAKLGVMAAVGGAAIGLAGGHVVPVIIAVLACLGFARLYTYKQQVESDLLRARIELVPEVDRAVASGRYIVPPKLPGQR